MASAITDMEIEALARGIGINIKLDGLGLKLGYIPAQMDIYKASNYSGANVTHQGTKQMLNDWRDKTPKEQQRPTLKKALEDSELVRLAEIHLGGEASMDTRQAGGSRTGILSEQPRTQTQTGGTNTINASGGSNVSANNIVGQQTNVYNSAPSVPAVHHHHMTTNVNRASAAPARPVYIPFPAAPKRQANTTPGPAPKRQKLTTSRKSTSKGNTSKPKGTTSKPKGTTSKPKGTTSKPKGTTSKPKATTSKPKGTTSKPKKTKNAPKAPKKKAPKTAKRPKVTQKKPAKAKKPKTQKSKSSRQARPKKKSKR